MPRNSSKWFIPALWIVALVLFFSFSLFLTVSLFFQSLCKQSLESLRICDANLSYTDLLLWFIRILFLLFVSLVGGIYLQSFYLKRESYEAILIFIWLLGLASYPWRLLAFKMSAIDTQTWGLIFFRVALFWEIFGFNCLLLTSIIFANRRHFQNIRLFILAVFCASLIISWEFPLNCFALSKRLTLCSTLSPSISTAVWILNLLASLSVYWDLYVRKSFNEALPMFFATLFVYGGWVLLLYSDFYLLVALGGVALCIGLWLYIRGLSLYYAPWQ